MRRSLEGGLPDTSPDVATKVHCAYAFGVLEAHLQGLPEPASDQFPEAVTALFVTWNIRSSSSGSWRLRGCIGTTTPRPLRTALHDYALTSALRDSRFAPVSARELKQLGCKVSLLSRFETAASWRDWTVGTHGIIIEFNDPEDGCRRSATFLPDVPPEQGWDVRDTLEALVRKAGYHGRVSDTLLSTVRLTRYQSTIASLTYDEYQAVKSAALNGGGLVSEEEEEVPVTATRQREILVTASR